jgi:hypothetical protein
MNIFHPFTPRLTEDQAAGALAMCLVHVAIHDAYAFLDEQSRDDGLLEVLNTTVTPDIRARLVLEFLIAHIGHAESCAKKYYQHKVDLLNFVTELEAVACKVCITALKDSKCNLTAKDFFTAWDSTTELYTGKAILGNDFHDSVPGQFGARVAAIFGESRYSPCAMVAIMLLNAAFLAHGDSKLTEKTLSRVKWEQKLA